MSGHLKRTSLYVSGNRPVNMIQAAFYGEDCLVYDLEDSVALSQKDAARFLVYNTLRFQRPKNCYTVVRINGIGSPYLAEDLEAMVLASPDAIRIPKVESGNQVQMLSEKVAQIERRNHQTPGKIRFWCNIESYLGVLYAREIATADPRVEAMALGAEDLIASMGAVKTRERMEIFYARNAILMACREAGIDALDAVYSDIEDLKGLEEEAIFARNLGFDGKTVVHPRQIDVVNACFAPSERQVHEAERILAAIEAGRRQGNGVVTLDGAMLDRPMQIRAEAVMKRAMAAGMDVGEEFMDGHIFEEGQ